MTKAVVQSGAGLGSILLCVLGMIVSANAQSTFGSIVGVVHDTTQAVVPGASVKIRSLEDNSTRSTTSDQNGSFEFVNLKPGNYAFSAEAQGFAEFQVPSAELTARQTLRIDVTLGIKSQSQTVEVSDTVAVINTENAVISDSINNLQITATAAEQSRHHNQSAGVAVAVAERATGQLRKHRSGRRKFGDGELLRRRHLHRQRAAERRAAGRVSIAGGNLRGKSNVVQQQRRVFAGGRRYLHYQKRHQSVSRQPV